MGKIDCNGQVDMWHDFPVELPWTSGGFTASAQGVRRELSLFLRKFYIWDAF